MLGKPDGCLLRLCEDWKLGSYDKEIVFIYNFVLQVTKIAVVEKPSFVGHESADH